MSDHGFEKPHVIAISNQKGGVGKTTTAINLGSALANQGKRILVIDLDPQGNASTGLGIAKEDRNGTTYDLLLGDAHLGELIHRTTQKNLHVIPANMDLSSADIDLVDNAKRSFLLQDALRGGADYDFVLIDCPPSLSILTINALVAADGVIIPLQSEFFALEGLSQLMLTLRDVRQTANPDLHIHGVLLTLHDARNRLSKQVEKDARDTLGELVFQTVVPRNVRVSEAPSYALSVHEYDPTSSGSRAYTELAEELLAQIHVKEV